MPYDARQFLEGLYQRDSATDPAPRLSPPDHPIVDYVAAVGVLLIDAVERKAITEDRYWDLAGQFDERAGIAEFCGGMSRADAERVAFDEISRELDQLET